MRRWRLCMYGSLRVGLPCWRSCAVSAKGWNEDLERRREAGISEETAFATPTALAQAMLTRVFASGVPTAGDTGDTGDTGDSIYGNDSKLRFWPQGAQRSYVLKVMKADMVWHGFVQQARRGSAWRAAHRRLCPHCDRRSEQWAARL